jgi:hypothetical protein
MSFAILNKWVDASMAAQTLCAGHAVTRARRGRGSGG